MTQYKRDIFEEVDREFQRDYRRGRLHKAASIGALVIIFLAILAIVTGIGFAFWQYV